MFRFHSLTPLVLASSLAVSLALAGCGGSSPTNVVTNPVTPPANIPVPTPTPTPVPTPTPTPVPTPTPTPTPTNPAQYGLIAAISNPSSDFSGHTSVGLTHGSASLTVTGDQNTLASGFSDLDALVSFQLTLVKTGTIKAGDVLPLTPTSASTSEYTEYFNFTSPSVWKADSGSVRVDSITSTGVYTVSLLTVHYSPVTTTSAKGTFEINGSGVLTFGL